MRVVQGREGGSCWFKLTATAKVSMGVLEDTHLLFVFMGLCRTTMEGQDTENCSVRPQGEILS